MNVAAEVIFVISCCLYKILQKTVNRNRFNIIFKYLKMTGYSFTYIMYTILK